MVTGKKAFEGKTQASLIAAIFERQPTSITVLQPLTPAALERIVTTCLAKDPDERWQSAADLRRELEWIAKSGTAAMPARAPAHGPWRERAAWIIVAAARTPLAPLVRGLHRYLRFWLSLVTGRVVYPKARLSRLWRNRPPRLLTPPPPARKSKYRPVQRAGCQGDRRVAFGRFVMQFDIQCSKGAVRISEQKVQGLLGFANLIADAVHVLTDRLAVLLHLLEARQLGLDDRPCASAAAPCGIRCRQRLRGLLNLLLPRGVSRRAS
jgi:hypothetical protein